MENVLTYILQANLLLGIVFLGYILLLKGVTFYRLNRIYFLVGGVYSLIYPFLKVDEWFREEVISVVPAVWDYMTDYIPESVADTFSLGHLLLSILLIGAGAFFVKLVLQLLSLCRIHFYSEKSSWKNYLFRNVFFPIVPFSFFNKIYVHQDQHGDPELYDIFKHEEIHVKGLHSLDILLFEMLLIGCWYNPFVWLMRKAVRQNLEFLTDQQVLDKGVDRQTYQYSLLNVTTQGVSLGVGNQFNFRTLKKRIMMMNKRRSSKIELSKYAFLLPIVILAGASLTVSKAEGKIEELVERIKETPVDAVLPVAVMQELVRSTDTIKQHKVEPNAVSGSTVGAFGVTLKGDAVGLRADSALNVVSGGEVEPILFVDGLRYYGNISRLDPNDIESIHVFKGKQAIALYGDQAKDGAVLIKTKEGSLTQRLHGKVPASIPSDSTKNVLRSIFISANPAGHGSKTKPIIVLDGKVMEDGYDVNLLNSADIHSVSVLKDKAAETLYGPGAKNGVLLISTKKGKDVRGAEVLESITVYGVARAREMTASEVIEHNRIIKERKDRGEHEPEEKYMKILDVNPEPQGGMVAFIKWLTHQVSYSRAAVDAKIEGFVDVTFDVQPDGSLTNIRAFQDLGYGTGDALVQVFKKSANWHPGVKDGKAVPVQYSFPVKVDLSK